MLTGSGVGGSSATPSLYHGPRGSQVSSSEVVELLIESSKPNLASPCKDCGTTKGRLVKKYNRYVRVKGRCNRCYQTHFKRMTKLAIARQPVKIEVKAKTVDEMEQQRRDRSARWVREYRACERGWKTIKSWLSTEKE